MLAHKVFPLIPQPTVAAICADTNAAVSAAGTTQNTATELTSADSDVTTVASGAGVVLASKGAPGDEQSVLNSGANPLNVYPPAGMKLNNLTTNLPMTLPVNTAAKFKFISATKIMGFLSA